MRRSARNSATGAGCRDIPAGAIDLPGLRPYLPVPDKLPPDRAQDIVFQLQIAQITHEREQKAERHEKTGIQNE
jgi:hypothetical protein